MTLKTDDEFNEKLIDTINKYWSDHNTSVEIGLTRHKLQVKDRVRGCRTRGYSGIKSNLVNGLPGGSE